MQLIQLSEVIDEDKEIVIHNLKFNIYAFTLDEYLDFIYQDLDLD